MFGSAMKITFGLFLILFALPILAIALWFFWYAETALWGLGLIGQVPACILGALCVVMIIGTPGLIYKKITEGLHK